MKKKKRMVKKPLAAALGTAFLSSAAFTAMAAEAPNPFVANDLPSEYELVGQMGRKDEKEGNCGEGNCGEGNCGEGNCGEGKCGGEGKNEGSCGEGRCGGK